MFRKIILLFFIVGLLCPKSSEAMVLFPFKGEVNPSKKEFFVEIDTGGKKPFVIQLVSISEHLYEVSINVDHLKTDFFDISTILESSLEIVRAENRAVRSLTGKIISKYTLLNYKPVKELSGQFEIKEQKVYFNSLSFGSIFCKGYIQLTPPFKIDLLIRLSGMDINDFLGFFADRKKIVANGQVDGEIYVSGSLGRMELEGKLLSYDGVVNQLEYSAFILDAKGVYPNINVSGSNITQQDGMTFNLVGMINLGDKENLGKQIKALVKEPLVRKDEQSLEWTLRRIRSNNRSGTTEIKYLRRKGKDLNETSEDDSGLFGIERRMEF